MKKIICILGMILINLIAFGEKEQVPLQFRIEEKKNNYVLIKIEEREKEFYGDKTKDEVKDRAERIKILIKKAEKKKAENKKTDKSKKFIFTLPEYEKKEE